MYYNDPTANQAIGSVQREWNRMAALAEEIRTTRDIDWALRESRRFTGIFARLLTEPTVKARPGD